MANFNMFRTRTNPVADRVWQRGENEIARKIFPSDLKGWASKPLAIEEGTVGLLFSNGRLMGQLPAGRHDLAGALKRFALGDLGLIEYMVCVDTSDVIVEFTLNKIPTSDPISADITARMVFSINDPPTFFRNVLKGRDSYTVEDLHAEIEPELRGVVGDVVGTGSINDLLRNTDTKRRLEIQLLDQLGAGFRHRGLTLDRASAFSFFSSAWESMREDDRKAAELAYRQEFLRKRRKAEYADQLDELTDQLDSELNKHGLNSTQSTELAKIDAAEAAKLKQIIANRDAVFNQITKDQLLSEEDRMELEHTIGLKRDARKHELDKARFLDEREMLDLKDRSEGARFKESVEREIEIDRLRRKGQLEGRTDEFDRDMIEMKTLLEIKKLKDVQNNENRKAELELWKDQTAFAAGVQEDQKRGEHGRQVEMTKVTGSLEIEKEKVRAERDIKVEEAKVKAGASDKVEGILKEMLQRDDARSDRDARLLEKAIEQTGKQGAGTIITPGGQVVSYGDKGGSGGVRCPHCKRIIPVPSDMVAELKACPFCAEKL